MDIWLIFVSVSNILVVNWRLKKYYFLAFPLAHLTIPTRLRRSPKELLRRRGGFVLGLIPREKGVREKGLRMGGLPSAYYEFIVEDNLNVFF